MFEKQVFIALILIVLTFSNCELLTPEGPTFDSALDAPIEGLSNDQNRLFVEGAEEFDEVYTRETGLGPIFVAQSCASCHARDNRGHNFTTLTRFGQSDTSGNQFLDKGAPQLQHNFIAGYQGEKIPELASSSRFIAPIVSGSGLLELVPEEVLILLSDPDDLDHNGISGRINWNFVPTWISPSNQAKTQNGKYICRFGRKAATYNLHQQVAQAFNQDIGITTTFLPQNPFNYLDGLQSTPTSDPDITDQSLNATVFYVQTLQAPFQRTREDKNVLNGASIFKKIQCDKCHIEKLMTGYSPINALSFKEFYPYTDLLLHDMGDELNDHYTEGTALPEEWRTTPLWGLGLASNVQGRKLNLLHDGRAKSIEQAIELHGGEGLNSRELFRKLNSSERIDLIKFLNSL